MILADNIMLLKSKFPKVLVVMKEYEEKMEKSNISSIPAKNGLANLVVHHNNQDVYLHSKYDPKNEAEKFIESLGDISSYKHVFFFGLGLGYQIKAFLEVNPTIPFTVFEPDPGVAYNFFEQCSLKQFFLKSWLELYIGFEHTDAYIQHFFNKISDQVLFVVLPSYERAFKTETEAFYDKFKNAIAAQKSAINVNLNYEKLWVVNSIRNFPKVLKTESILRQKKKWFQNKPVIVAAAGPSLQEEFETLRYIKEHKLAYIFAVGSANKALIAQGIMPDALSSYDPNPWNHTVFEEVVFQNIQDIPLIFGSSVGFEIVQTYPGPLLHMITSQDTISGYFLNGKELAQKAEIVSDAPSIALLTLEILAKMEAYPIILAGQNFAVKEGQYYAQGVSYSARPTNVTDAEEKALVAVEAVDGGEAMTFNYHIQARIQMENMIKSMPSHIKVLNTTRGGAKISGTEYLTMDQVIEQYLNKEVVSSVWYESESMGYNQEYLNDQIVNMTQMISAFEDLVNSIVQYLQKIDHYHKYKDSKNIFALLPKFDQTIKKLLANDYFNVLIKPSMRVQFDLLNRVVERVPRETDALKKAKLMLKIYGSFIYDCQQVSSVIYPYYQDLYTVLTSKIV